MLWIILGAILRTAITLHRTITALGAAIFIGFGIYDYLIRRRKGVTYENGQRRLA